MSTLAQCPPCGDRLLRFAGDRIHFTLSAAPGCDPVHGWRACLRTNLGRAQSCRDEIIQAVRQGRPPFPTALHDVPMEWTGHQWEVDLPLVEVGYFQAKAYAVDARGWQHWPEGGDTGVSVHPAAYRQGNTIYCAFVRMFGATRHATSTAHPERAQQLKTLDDAGFTVIPPSGKLRDLVTQVPHIFDTLGCRILHLLPVNPTPTTYARYGRYGSPYACLDLTAIDLALVEFDQRTNGVDQFRELASAVHQKGGRLFLDMVINHTGWGSTLLENRPEWFMRHQDGRFVSPGAWGVTWEDLVELEHADPGLRECLADAFLEWCRRGVDGFRCDAGYKVPAPVWQYIVARVRQEYPDTVFLLEGLGGGWGDTEALLTEGGMQWAYSELFQNYSPLEISGYLDHALRQSERCGLLVHYSETHDNERLAAKGRAWSLMRNRLCALTSVAGGYGFTCGVEWLASERVNVHSCRGLAWGRTDNLVEELGRLNRLLHDHPCFFAGAVLKRLSPPSSAAYVLLRVAENREDAVLVLVNSDVSHAAVATLTGEDFGAAPASFRDGIGLGGAVELLGQPVPAVRREGNATLAWELPPGAVYCLAVRPQPAGPGGEEYRCHKLHEAAALSALVERVGLVVAGKVDLPPLAAWVATDLAGYLGAVSKLKAGCPSGDVVEELVAGKAAYPEVVVWRESDQRRVLMVPPRHWIVVVDPLPFRVRFDPGAGRTPLCLDSFPVSGGHAAFFKAPEAFLFAVDAKVEVERHTVPVTMVRGTVRCLAAGPYILARGYTAKPAHEMVLLTNGRGGMARLAVDLGRIRSKYDCVLGANLHPKLPVDRHVLVKRLRVWVNADGFISPLDADSLSAFEAGPPAHWSFIAPGGDGRAVGIEVRVDMVPGQNTVIVQFGRTAVPKWRHRELPDSADVRLTVRVDIEDRNFHWETKRTGGAEHHFASHTSALSGKPGFCFTPASDRRLTVVCDAGEYRAEAEWCEGLGHPVEASRGMTPSGDAYSPGWFEIPLAAGRPANLVLTAEPQDGQEVDPARTFAEHEERLSVSLSAAGLAPGDHFGQMLTKAIQAFVVRRGDLRTVIAGYPWFLDWGRDTLICARGLLAAGLGKEVLQLLVTFGRFEKDGTLPNTLHGDDASNRDTSDAPLWYSLVCEDLACLQSGLPHGAAVGADGQRLADAPVYGTVVDRAGRKVSEVLSSIACGYIRGTPNGIRMDPQSALIWSPSHFTWMDTNFPAATPRQGYPICIQALWIRLLGHMELLGVPGPDEGWSELRHRALSSVERLFWREDLGYYADVLACPPGQSAAQATQDAALRSNCLLLVSLGLVRGDRARRCVAAAVNHLAVPGALRSLAPLRVERPLPVIGNDGRLLNDPGFPYWGRYEGDEDTRRKPAYHNGTAWTWTFPTLCEALALAWDLTPRSIDAARAYLGSLDRVLTDGCIGHLPEILDGDAPHTQRGCDAQAWSVTEALRVWKWLGQCEVPEPPAPEVSAR